MPLCSTGAMKVMSFTATVTNASITVEPKDCTVTVGSGTATDGKIDCT